MDFREWQTSFQYNKRVAQAGIVHDEVQQIWESQLRGLSPAKRAKQLARLKQKFLQTYLRDRNFKRYYGSSITAAADDVKQAAIQLDGMRPEEFMMSDQLRVLEDRQADSLELAWHEGQCPYYKIYPDYLGMFRKTSLEIPINKLQLPYPQCEIRIPADYEWLIDGRQVHAITISRLCVADLIPAQRRDATSPAFLIVRVQHLNDAIPPSGRSEVMPMLHDSPETLQYAIDQFGDNTSDYTDVLRLVVSVCFLATGGDRLVQPDVLNADFPAYLDAVNKQNKGTQRYLAEKANKRRKTTGCTVGRESILGRRSQAGKPSSGAPTDQDRQLQHAHMRGGHMHLYWTGPGRKTPVMKFVAPTTVRPDLPPKEAAVGTRTPTVDVT